MTAIGFFLLASGLLLSYVVDAGRLSIPEWLEVVGGVSILVGAILMIAGFALHLWRVFP